MVCQSNRSAWRVRGFTFTDLLVVIFIICMLSGVVFSAGGLIKARETLRRVNCARNLKTIGLAIMLYGNENKGMYPRTVFKIDEPTTQYTGVDCKDPFHDKGAPKANDITAAMFLLLRTQDIKPEIFICPSTDAQALKFPDGKTAQDFSNFKSEDELSYSVANLYPNAAAVRVGYKMNLTTGAEIAIVADMNPGQVGEFDATTKKGPKDEKAGAAVMKKANSMNHRGYGQNVLYGDGHVEFQVNPFCGQKQDNIYTVSGSDDGKVNTSDAIAGFPKWAGDSVLLPAATKDPHKKTEEEEAREPVDPKQLQAQVEELRIFTTKDVLAGLRTAVEVFETDTGRFPTTEEGLDALVKAPAGIKNWHGPYIESVPPKDSWGRSYVYRFPGKANPKVFELFSLGADGRESDDDIGRK